MVCIDNRDVMYPTQLPTEAALYHTGSLLRYKTKSCYNLQFSRSGDAECARPGPWQQGKRTGFELARRPCSSGAAALPLWALPSYLSLSLVILAQTNLALFAVVV
jgi:hypothetical protein